MRKDWVFCGVVKWQCNPTDATVPLISDPGSSRLEKSLTVSVLLFFGLLTQNGVVHTCPPL